MNASRSRENMRHAAAQARKVCADVAQESLPDVAQESLPVVKLAAVVYLLAEAVELAAAQLETVERELCEIGARS